MEIKKILQDYTDWLYDMDRLKIDSQIEPFETTEKRVDYYIKSFLNVKQECEGNKQSESTEQQLQQPYVINWVAVYDRLPEQGTFCITKDESDGYDIQYWKGYWETEYPVKENDVLYWAEVKPPCL